MKKLILALTALSLAAAFTACRSTEEETVENRLRNEYGWQGGALPAAAPDSQTVIAAPDEPGTAPKNAGIVSTVDIRETVVIDEQPPLPPAPRRSLPQEEPESPPVLPPPAERQRGRLPPAAAPLPAHRQKPLVRPAIRQTGQAPAAG